MRTIGAFPVREAWRPLALAAVTACVIAGCQENLAGGAACPSLCPDTLTIRDTVLTAESAIDTALTVVGVPPIGAEPILFLADYTQGGGHVQTVAVLRFDTLTRAIIDTTPGTPPRPFDRVDTVSLSLNIIAPPTGQDSIFIPGDSVTFLVYDVDTSAVDADTAAVHARFSSPPIASRTFARDSVKGTISIPLDSGFLGPRVREGKRVRLGIAVASSQDVRVLMGSSDAGNGAALHYFGYAGSEKLVVVAGTSSRAPLGPNIQSLADYTIVVRGTPPPPAGMLATGGIPASRIFIRFKIPPELLDSATTIVRANLVLYQAGNTQFASNDTMKLVTRVVRATPLVTDPAKASLLSAAAADAGVSGIIPLSLFPTATQPDTLALVGLFNLWKREGPGQVQRAIVLQASTEGLDPRQYFFYSTTAQPDSLRPRLRVSYIPKSKFGLP
jgi:hypothetical protein